MNQSASPTTSMPAQLPAHVRRAYRVDTLLLGGILLLGLLLRLPGMALPLERDEGAYAYIAYNWLHGGLPYRDAFDHKPPLIYLLFIPPLLTGMSPTTAIRAWATLLFLTSLVLVYLIGRRVWDRWSALLAALIFAVAGSAFDLQGLVLNTDQALVLPALVALWAAIRLVETDRLTFAVGLGAALAAAVLIKPVAVALVVLPLLACPRGVRGASRLLAGVVLGVALVALPLAAYFWMRGGLPDLIFGVLTYNRLYAAEARDQWQLGALVDMFAPFVPLLLAALGGVALLVVPRGTIPLSSRRAGWLVAGSAAALLLAAVGSLRPFVHYYYPSLPCLALLAAPSLRWLWTEAVGTTAVQQLAGRLAPVLLGALLIGPFGAQNAALLGSSAEEQAVRLYGDGGKYYFAPAPTVAEYIQAHTAPDDYIYIFAAEPQVYLLAQRPSASRYIYDYPLMLLPGAATELHQELLAHPPKLVITYYGVRPTALSANPYLASLTKLTEIGGFEIYGAK